MRWWQCWNIIFNQFSPQTQSVSAKPFSAQDKFKQNEMLVAAQAVGVATVFGAPISGE